MEGSAGSLKVPVAQFIRESAQPVVFLGDGFVTVRERRVALDAALVTAATAPQNLSVSGRLPKTCLEMRASPFCSKRLPIFSSSADRITRVEAA
jgi:hypothetical protein